MASIFVASGAFYEKAQLPELIQIFMAIYPLSYVIEELQKVMLWGEFDVMSYFVTCFSMILVCVIIMYLNEKKFIKRFLS